MFIYLLYLIPIWHVSPDKLITTLSVHNSICKSRIKRITMQLSAYFHIHLYSQCLK